MAQVVCIAKGTEKVGLAEIGDVVAIHEDDVELTGSGYANFEVIKIENQTAADLRAKWATPEHNRAVRIPAAGKWAFMEEKAVWKNAENLWCDLIETPKYSITLKGITAGDKTSLADKSTVSTSRDSILAKYQEKIHLNAANNVVVADLN